MMQVNRTTLQNIPAFSKDFKQLIEAGHNQAQRLKACIAEAQLVQHQTASTDVPNGPRNRIDAATDRAPTPAPSSPAANQR
jgi:hypothetical protein